MKLISEFQNTQCLDSFKYSENDNYLGDFDNDQNSVASFRKEIDCEEQVENVRALTENYEKLEKRYIKNLTLIESW